MHARAFVCVCSCACGCALASSTGTSRDLLGRVLARACCRGLGLIVNGVTGREGYGYYYGDGYKYYQAEGARNATPA